LIGRNLSGVADYLVVGESIPGGTTTSLAVLLAMGVDAEGKVSSSMPDNPHELKIRVAREGLEVAKQSIGASLANPFKAISAVGDPMIPACAGLICGAAEKIPVLMAGGTQMCSVLNVVRNLSPKVLSNLAIGTTRWIIEDKTSDIRGLVSQIAPVPILAINLNFSDSKFKGLRAYERGVVKEGVGAGGSCIAAVMKTNGLLDRYLLFREIEKNYEALLASVR
ncbi:MAG: TIGR00303 family protein, partial [Candidatus Methanomethylicia archaeon]|nr:TIGR00303 family protein [Candidatus Methanomethylicia archaeon]